jgi:hypothetical protein
MGSYQLTDRGRARAHIVSPGSALQPIKSAVLMPIRHLRRLQSGMRPAFAQVAEWHEEVAKTSALLTSRFRLQWGGL